jgi:hypothetical protein
MTPVQAWEYLTVYLSGILDFPDTVSHQEIFIWAGKAITQQLNDLAQQGWELIDLRWLSDMEVMVTFKRLTGDNNRS